MSSCNKSSKPTWKWKMGVGISCTPVPHRIIVIDANLEAVASDRVRWRSDGVIKREIVGFTEQQ